MPGEGESKAQVLDFLTGERYNRILNKARILSGFLMANGAPQDLDEWLLKLDNLQKVRKFKVYA